MIGCFCNATEFTYFFTIDRHAICFYFGNAFVDKMLSLDTGKHDIFLQRCITTKYREKIHVKNISVLWKYKNILANDNNLIKFITVPDHPATDVAFEEGYWTFNMITDRLAESGITLERHKHDNRRSTLSPKS